MLMLLADNQEITRAGLTYLAEHMIGIELKCVEDKASLIEQLRLQEQCIVVLDYTLFDINDVEDLIIISQRFPMVRWLLFSEDLSRDFVSRIMVVSQAFGIVMKDSSLNEIREAISYAQQGRRYICQRMAELLVAAPAKEEILHLTKTETEILRSIALGLTTKEIAEQRFASFHTINTHRKNIFRKLNVNNVHEAIKYALRAGLIDSAEYFI